MHLGHRLLDAFQDVGGQRLMVFVGERSSCVGGRVQSCRTLNLKP